MRRRTFVSAIGASADSPSAYARTKAMGEKAVLAARPAAVVFRPSTMFGPEDTFFNRFAALARMAPVLPMPVDPASAEVAARLPAEVRLGTSSWSFPGWTGLVYAPRDGRPGLPPTVVGDAGGERATLRDDGGIATDALALLDNEPLDLARGNRRRGALGPAALLGWRRR